jgi:beta-glucosidase
MGWPVVPQFFTRMLQLVSDKYRTEIIVTENGVAIDGEDDVESACALGQCKPGSQRIAYVHNHIAALKRAIADGCNVRGFFLWSLLDNLEWQHGRRKRFGLVHVDFATLERTKKPAFDYYAALVRA